MSDEETKVTIRPPGYDEADFEEKFTSELTLVNRDDWHKDWFWHNIHTKKGTWTVRKEYGKPAKYRTQSALVFIGLRDTYRRYQSELNEVEDKYTKLVNTAESTLANQVTTGTSNLGFSKTTVGEKNRFFLPESDSGRFAAYASFLLMSKSELARCLLSVSLSQADCIVGEKDALENYREEFFEYIDERHAMMKLALREIEER